MRLIVTFLLIATLGASALVVNYSLENSNLHQQVDDLTIQTELLLEELEQNISGAFPTSLPSSWNRHQQ